MNQFHSSPHLPAQNSVTQMMLAVLYALIPGTLVYVYFFGWGVIINMLICVITALALEALMLKLRNRPGLPFLLDGSALITAVLLSLALPNLAPWWLGFLGAAFAIVLAKHLFGGLGYNPFNPAMVGYAMLLVAFPREMTAWVPATDHGLGFMDNLQYSLFSQLPAGTSYDSVTMATPLDTVKNQLGQNYTLDEIRAANSGIFGNLSGHGWEWVNLVYMIGGLTLIYMKVIRWRIPVATLGSLFVISLFFTLIDPDVHPGPFFHLFGGAAMLGAFFIATDPVTASTTPRGQIIFGIGIGIFTYVIRTWGGYPDGIAFAVLLMNMAAPTIDYFTQPRVFGEERE